jgi:phosphatidylinositol glycan class B
MPPWSARTALGLSLVVGLAARVWGAFDDGIYWPDEIYQSFEPAHSLVFGAGLIPWEFVEGARSWALPGLIAAVLKGCAIVGFDTPPTYIRVVKLLFAVLGVVTAAGVHRLVRAFNAPDWAAVAAAALVCFMAPVIYFAPRAMAENACTAPLVWGLALLFEDQAPGRRKIWLAGSLLGLSVLLRLQCATVVLAVVLALALHRRWRTLGWALGALGVWAFFYGALDAATWHGAPNAKFGGWFHSAVVYVRFNLIEGRGAQWGTSPWYYYFQYLFQSMPLASLALGLGFIGALARRRWELPLLTAAFFLLHLASPHKELRFIVPGLPLAAACLGVALSFGTARFIHYGSAAVVGAGLISLTTVPSLTMGQLGAYLERPQASAWDDYGHVNRLLLVAGRQPDLCGVRVDVADMAWVGGSTYLHRRVPLYRPNVPPDRGFFNYLLAPAGYGPPLTVIAQDRGVVLYRLPLSVCTEDPRYAWRL